MKTHLLQILLVEDDPKQADVLINCINKLGYVCAGLARTSVEVLQLYQTVEPDLVIINTTSAAIADGPALAQRLLQRRVIPVLLLTETTAAAAALQEQVLWHVTCLAKVDTPAYLQCAIQLAMLNSTMRLGGGPQSVPAAPMVAPNYLFVRERGVLIRLDPALIACVEREEKYCLITMANGKRHSVRLPLRELMGYMEASSFVQVHRSWLVNLTYIERIDTATGVILMVGGTEVPLGRSFREGFLQRLRLIE